MFSLFRKKKSPADQAVCEVSSKIGSENESFIDMAIVSMIQDPKEGSLYFLQATAREVLHVSSTGDDLSGACIVNSPEEDCIYLTAHSTAKRSRNFRTNNPEFARSLEIPFMSLLFDSQSKVGLIVNPDDEHITVTISPRYMEMFRAIARASFTLKEGSYYHTPAGDVDLVKVLKSDEGGVHVRLYSNHYSPDSNDFDFSDLKISTCEDSGKRGIGHIPISLDRFLAWGPTHVADGVVTEDELEGYNTWKNASGGYF